jgi:hypothetical protein
MATLHGKKLTDKQYSALRKKWASADKKFWKQHYQAEITRLRKRIAELKKMAAETKRKNGSALNIQLNAISRAKSEIAELQTKIKNL